MTGEFNNLTPAQVEKPALLAEECGEVAQIVGKIIELGDGDVAMSLLVGSGDIKLRHITNYANDKLRVIQHRLHHARGE